MAESDIPSDGTAVSADKAISAGETIGWLATGFGVLMITTTILVSAYLMVTAEPGLEFVGWFFTMMFFGAFPAMTGLGLIIWGGRIVRRARSKQQVG